MILVEGVLINKIVYESFNEFDIVIIIINPSVIPAPIVSSGLRVDSSGNIADSVALRKRIIIKIGSAAEFFENWR